MNTAHLPDRLLTLSTSIAGLTVLCAMVYKAIGLMSGSSLDGLDICYTLLEESRGKWKFDIQAAACIPYDDTWRRQLHHANQLYAPELLRLHTAYGRFIAQQVIAFAQEHLLEHRIDFIASHGHTIFHDPAHHTSFQLGDGATIAALTKYPVISDLRALDVALGGQGAPIVPIGDQILFGDFDYLLNIGGIVNMTVHNRDKSLAFDVCNGNQMLDTLSQRLGQPYDKDGRTAAAGTLLTDVLDQLNAHPFYKQAPPKSLSNEAARALVFPTLFAGEHPAEDLLRTGVAYVVAQVDAAIQEHPSSKENPRMLLTGGGAFNNFLVDEIRHALSARNVAVVVPYEQVAKFKEALVMALFGALRWREETNVLASVTGASRDSISGALWMGHSYQID